MTNILTIAFAQLVSKPETLRFPERPAPEGRFRGPISQKVERCVSCTLCDMVCVSGAIEMRTFDDHAEWAYDPGRCTFCGRCLKFCPVGALRQEKDVMAPYAEQRAVVTKHLTEYPICVECGKPARPFSIHHNGGHFVMEHKISKEGQLCESCREGHANAPAPAEPVHVGATESRVEGLADER